MHLAIVCTVAASWYLVGLSVTVGLVTYPSFARVGDADWVRFHDHHSVRISWAVGGAWAAQVLGLVWWLERGGAGIAVTVPVITGERGFGPGEAGHCDPYRHLFGGPCSLCARILEVVSGPHPSGHGPDGAQPFVVTAARKAASISGVIEAGPPWCSWLCVDARKITASTVSS